MQKFPSYTPDGRFEKIVFDELAYAIKNSLVYSEFLKRIEHDLNSLAVPCLILTPLNFLNVNGIKTDLSLSPNIKIFKTENYSIEKIKTKGKNHHWKSTLKKQFMR